jgi:hypothetical protein
VALVSDYIPIEQPSSNWQLAFGIWQCPDGSPTPAAPLFAGATPAQYLTILCDRQSETKRVVAGHVFKSLAPPLASSHSKPFVTSTLLAPSFVKPGQANHRAFPISDCRFPI